MLYHLEVDLNKEKKLFMKNTVADKSPHPSRSKPL